MMRFFVVSLLALALLTANVAAAQAANPEPDLLTLLADLGFTAVSPTAEETFPPGSYEIRLLAEFAANHNITLVESYPQGTGFYTLLFDGPVGNFGVTAGDVTAVFAQESRFGLAALTAGGAIRHTEDGLNLGGMELARVLVDDTNPDRFFIGFEDGGDGDFQDTVLQLTRLACEPNPNGDLTGVIAADPSRGTITNRSANCFYEVGMAAYEKRDGAIAHQVLFDFDTAVIAPGETRDLTVALPPCAVQVDLFFGEVLLSLDGARYGERRLAARHVAADFCMASAAGTAVIAGQASSERVTLQGDDGETRTAAVTHGRYRFEGLRAGRYQLTAETVQQVVTVRRGAAATADFVGTVPTAVRLRGGQAAASANSLLPLVLLWLAVTAISLRRRALTEAARSN